MKIDLSKLKPLQDEVDLYRLPDHKDDPGWRGPCDLLDISFKDNTAIVKHQSMPYIVSLRHIRPHMGRHLRTLMYVTAHVLQVHSWPHELS